MQLTGIVSQWNEQKGFGFILPDDKSTRIFVHVTGLRNAAHRPRNGDRVGYQLDKQADGKLRAIDVYQLNDPHRAAPVAPPKTRIKRSRQVERKSVRPFALLVVIGVLAGVALWVKQSSFLAESPAIDSSVNQLNDASLNVRVLQPPASPSFQCQSGKSHCSQMSSCAEATFYLQHCPGTIMDGDGDGKPCEDQWCGH